MPYLIRRLLHMVFVLWAIATVVFLMFRLMPGDPSTAFIDPTFTEDQQREIRAQFGLDRPLPEQYLVYLGNLLRGEFGLSFRQRQPVLGLVLDVLPNTLLLTVSALLVAYLIGTVLGALMAWRRGGAFEAVAVPVVLATRAAPEAAGAASVVAAGTFGMGRDPRLEQAVAAIERQAGSDPAEARATAAAIGATVAEARVITLPEPPPMPPEVLAELLRSLVTRLVA